ncbi:MFS transporter [Priestia megaterium]|uniref:MFS transporter n=1 Tax=Priestia megaterium TaxID=1404 RepID=UPI001482BB15|nr:MFS transporter [Priestia megaterium]
MDKKLLKNPNFVIYLILSFFVRGGDTIFKIALILFIISKGGTAGTVGVVLILTILPAVLFGPVSGIFSDRFNLKVIIHLANFVRATMLILIPFVSNISSIYIIGFILAVATLFSVPSQKVILPLIVEREDIPVGAGYLASTRSIIDTLIPIFGSGLTLLIGFTQTFFINASFYILASALLLFLKFDGKPNQKPHQEGKKKSVFVEVIDGFKYIFENKKLKVITIASIFTLGLSAGIEILIPIHILFDMKYSDSAYGLLIGILGAGIAIGGIIIPKLKAKLRLSALFIFAFAIVLDGLGFLFFNLLSSSLILSLIIMFISGISSAGFLIMVDSYMQTEVEKIYLGRTYSSYFSLSNIFSVLIMGVVSLGAEKSGTSLMFTLCSVGILITGLITLYLSITEYKDNLNAEKVNI